MSNDNLKTIEVLAAKIARHDYDNDGANMLSNDLDDVLQAILNELCALRYLVDGDSE